MCSRGKGKEKGKAAGNFWEALVVYGFMCYKREDLLIINKSKEEVTDVVLLQLLRVPSPIDAESRAYEIWVLYDRFP